MGSDGDNETALSDFEEDDFEPAPEVLSVSGNTNKESDESLKALFAELESEKNARKAAETAKAELESSSSRLMLLSQQAVRQRDEALRQKDEALRLREDVTRRLAEAVEARDDALKRNDAIRLEKDEIMRQKDEVFKTRESAKGEIETAARLLVTASDNLTAMASGIKAFSGGLPRTTKYSGLAAIAYGFCKRAEEIVDEALKQRESALKSRNEMHEQMEQRNIQIAIEVSELEASVSHLKEGLQRKGMECENWQKLVAEKDSKVVEIEHKVSVFAADAEGFKRRIADAENKSKNLETEIQKQKEMFEKQFQMLSKASQNLVHLSQTMHFDGNLQENFVVPQLKAHQTDKMHEACLLAWRSVSDLAAALTVSWQETEELRLKERKELEGKMERLGVKEKEVTALLRSVLENKEDTRRLRSKKAANSDGIARSADNQRDEAITLASALEIEVNFLRQEIVELEKSSTETRIEADKLKFLSNAQTKDLSEKAAYIEQLEQREGTLTHKIEVLSMEMSTVQEEVERWKDAATEEATAGVAVLEEVEKCKAEIASLNEELAELRKSLEEKNKKLLSKEEMAAAAVTARNAAERSLRIADERATDLRQRLEEMAQQLDEAEGRHEQNSICGMGFLNVCCSWLRTRVRPSASSGEIGRYQAAEMEELMEPLV